MRYAEMHNGTVVRFHYSLPRGWRNISNFFKLDESQITDLEWSGNPGRGFWKVISTEKPAYNEQTQKVSSEHVVDPDNSVVREVWTVTDLSQEEIQAQQMVADAQQAQKWSELRSQRNLLLSSCDWTLMPDSPLSAEQRAAWIAYRQQLRDLPQQVSSPENVVFPTPPSGNP